MAHVTSKEEAAINEVMQMLEAQPLDTTSLTSLTALVLLDDQIPSQREKLAVLVSTGKSKEAIRVQLTHDQIKRLSDKDIQSLIDSALMLFSKGVGMVVSMVIVKNSSPPPTVGRQSAKILY